MASEVVKRTLTQWVNHVLSSTSSKVVVTDLYFDLRDGHVMRHLLQHLSPDDARGYARVELSEAEAQESPMTLINRCLDFLRCRLHCRLLNHVVAIDISNGNAEATLDTVFVLAVIQHFNIAHLEHETVLKTVERSIERQLLGWVRSSVTSAPEDVLVLLNNLDMSKLTLIDCFAFQRGLILYALMLSLTKDLFRPSDCDRGLEFLFQEVETKFRVPSIVEPNDISMKGDGVKRASLLYLMSLYKVLAQKELLIDLKDEKEEEAIGNCVGVSTPTKALGKDRGRSFASFCALCEEVLAWVLHVDDQLQSMQKVIKEELEDSQTQFDEYLDFVFKVDEERAAVKEVELEGELVLSANLSESEKQEVKVRCKLLLTRWSDFRRRALDRQQEMTDALMSLQQSRLDELVEWVKNMEDRVSKATEMGANVDEATQALGSHRGLYQELKDKHSRLPAFTLIEASSSSSNEPSITTTTTRERGQYAFFEDRADALSRRWGVLYQWMEEREQSLIEYKEIWAQFDSLRGRLLKYIEAKDKELQFMEQSPTEEHPRLLLQRDTVLTIDKTVRDDEVSSVDRLEVLAEKLLKMAEVSQDSRAVRAINTSLEVVLERWEVFLVRLEAQKTRLSRSGLPLDLNNGCTEKPNSGTKAVKEESSIKRRRVDSSKRMHFEAQHQQASCSLTATYECLSLATLSSDISTVVASLNAFMETEPKVCSVLSLGNDLTSAIVEEQDYPDLYLKNIEAKISNLKQHWAKCQNLRTNLEHKRDYLQAKEALYRTLEASRLLLADTREQIFPISDRHEDLVQTFDEKTKIEKMKNEQVHNIKKMANQVTFLPAALDDPSNSIKRDVYALSESWEALWSDLDHVTMKSKGGEYVIAQNGDDRPTLEQRQQPLLRGENRKIRVGELRKEETEDMESLLASQALRLKQSIKEIGNDHGNRYDEREWSEVQSEISGLTSWLSEVLSFLSSEDLADDEVTLKAQHKESSALLEDFKTLSNSFEMTRSRAEMLLQLNSPSTDNTTSHLETSSRSDLITTLESLELRWQEASSKAKAKNTQLYEALQRCESNENEKNEILSSDNLKSRLEEVESTWVTNKKQEIMRPEELRLESKTLQRLEGDLEALQNEVMKNLTEENDDLEAMRKRLDLLQSELTKRHRVLKQGSLLYGDLKALLATWMDAVNRLERRLGTDRLSVGADAEEISEEIEDLETILKTHSDSNREEKIQELVEKLRKENLFTQLIEGEVKRVQQRWSSMASKACKRKSLLEGSMAVAQEWESKLVEVQAWLEEKDSFISFHVDNEIQDDTDTDNNGDDDDKNFVVNRVYCSEQQELLREFEDRENLLAALDEQVDAYRESGKHEAASRLEDQLQFIHSKFQALEMKLELLQSDSPSDYEPRLNRVRRQLNDIEQNIAATGPQTIAQDAIGSKIDHTRCILNALYDIEPEVRSVIEVGTRMLSNGGGSTTSSRAKCYNRTDEDELGSKIEGLRHDFNRTIDQVEYSRNKLELLLEQSDRFHDSISNIQFSMSEIESNLEPYLIKFNQSGLQTNIVELDVTNIQRSFEDMKRIRDQIIGLQHFRNGLEEHRSTTLIDSFEFTLSRLQSNFTNLAMILNQAFKGDISTIQPYFNPEDGILSTQNITVNEVTGKADLGRSEYGIKLNVTGSEEILKLNDIENDDEEIDTLPTHMDNMETNPSLLSSTTIGTTDDDEARADEKDNDNSSGANDDIVSGVKLTPKSSDGVSSITSDMYSSSSPKQGPITLPKPSKLSSAWSGEKERRMQMEINEFSNNSDNLLVKITDFARNLENDEKNNSKCYNNGIGLKLDIIDMEKNGMEAEVDTLVSRGQTMLLLYKRANLNCNEKLINEKIQELKTSWQRVLLLTSSVKSSLKADLQLEEEFKKTFDALQDFRVKLTSQLNGDPKVIFFSKLQISLKEKSSQLSKLQEVGLKLRKKRSKALEERDLKTLSAEFREMKLKAEQLIKSRTNEDAKEDHSGKTSSSTPNKNSLILKKIAAVKEAIKAINRQLDTQVLSNKHYENLPLQRTALDAARDALERLRPCVREVNEFIERLETEAISVENFENIVSKSETLRTQWHQVQQRFSDRHDLFVRCSQTKTEYEEQLIELRIWINNAMTVLPLHLNNNEHNDDRLLEVERSIPTRDALVHELVAISKELMQSSSAEEKAIIKMDVAKVLAKWRELLVALQTHREKEKRAALLNNVRFMRDWLDRADEVLRKPTSNHDIDNLTSSLAVFEADLEQRRDQMAKLQNEITSLKNKLEAENKDKKESDDNAQRDISTLIEDVSLINVRFQELEKQLPLRCHLLETTMRDLQHFDKDLNELEKLLEPIDGHCWSRKSEILANVQEFLAKIDGVMSSQKSKKEENMNSSSLFCILMPAEMGRRIETLRAERLKLQKQIEKEARKEALLSGTDRDNGPEKFARLRDDYDYIERKQGWMRIMSVPEGDVESLTKQAHSIKELKDELESKAISMESHIRDAEAMVKPEPGLEGFLHKVRQAWPVLMEETVTTLNVVDNALINMRIFENDINTIDQRLSVTESSLKRYKSQFGSALFPGVEEEQQEQLQQIASAVNLLEENFAEISDHASRLESLSTKLELQRNELQRRLANLRQGVDTAHRLVIQGHARPVEASDPNPLVHSPLDGVPLDFSSNLPPNWERRLTEDEHLPFYVDHCQQKTQWTHPSLQTVLNGLEDTKCIRYAAYRMALKLRRIQTYLTLDSVDIESANEAFTKHGLYGMTEGDKLGVDTVLQVLITLYTSNNTDDRTNVPQANQNEIAGKVDECLSWLLLVHDSRREGLISRLSLTSTLLLLCRGSLTEKYLLLYKQVVPDKTGLIGRDRLMLLLRECTKVPNALGEEDTFKGDNAILFSTANSCFEVNQKLLNKKHWEEVNSKAFLYWLRCEPQLLLWLPLLHRLIVSESSVHKCRCKTCNTNPILGFRYHCLKCNLDICSQCFLTLGHKSSHPVQEHCTSTGRLVNICNFGHRMRYSFRSEKMLRKKKEKKVSYLPISVNDDSDEDKEFPNMETTGELEDGNDSADMEVTPNMTTRPRLVFASSPPMSDHDTTRTEDEHEAIGRLCRRLSPEHVTVSEASTMGDDALIKRLTEEHEHLVVEYNALKSDLSKEERPEELRKMEHRALILEDHNRKLETQIKRLRALLPEQQQKQPPQFATNADESSTAVGKDDEEEQTSSLHLSDCCDTQTVLD